MKKYQIAVIGGGPAGMMAAIQSAKNLSNSDSFDVVLIEKNNTLGKKLLLTGGGRCNLTNDSSVKDMLPLFGKNNSFLKHSLFSMDPKKLMDFFKVKGLDFKIENQRKVYPITDDSKSILEVLKKYLKELNVDVLLSTKVTDIERKGDFFNIEIKNKHQKNLSERIRANKVILATGGVTYPSTGSTGDGIKFAKKLGHSITPLNPGLVPFKIKEQWIKELSGLKLEDVGLNFIIINNSSKKKISSRGTVLLTHFGLSGPAILDFSRELSFFSTNLNDLFPAEFSLDLMLDKTPEKLKEQLNNDFQEKGKTIIKNYLKNILPKNMVGPFLGVINVDPQKKLNQISRKEKNRILENLKNLKLTIEGSLSIEKAMVTCGGISYKNINSKTTESRIIPGIYFAGEIIEFCGPTGGYNLQIAFSTGYNAGVWAAQTLNEI